MKEEIYQHISTYIVLIQIFIWWHRGISRNREKTCWVHSNYYQPSTEHILWMGKTMLTLNPFSIGIFLRKWWICHNRFFLQTSSGCNRIYPVWIHLYCDCQENLGCLHKTELSMQNVSIQRWSMYGITYAWVIYGVNVGKEIKIWFIWYIYIYVYIYIYINLFISIYSIRWYWRYRSPSL